MSKKARRVRKADEPLRWYLKQHQRWLRRAGVALGLLAVGVAVWFVVDPLQGPPTAVDATGEEVEVGVLERPGAAPRTGVAAPDFVLPDYDREAVYLNQFEDKVVFINFWASWCTFCEAEMPDIVRIAEQFPDDVVVLAINRGESKGTAKGWSDGHDFPELANVHWLLDEREDVTDAYRVGGMPQSFVVSRTGNVFHELRRVTDYDEILSVVERALGASSARAAP